MYAQDINTGHLPDDVELTLERFEPQMCLNVSMTPLPSPVVKPSSLVAQRKAEWKPIIEKFALQYTADSSSMLKVAECESGYNPEAHNKNDPNGGSFGIYQYQIKTFYGSFNSASKSLSFTEPDINNPHQQVELTAYLFARGKMGLWSCWYLINGLPVPWLQKD